MALDGHTQNGMGHVASEQWNRMVFVTSKGLISHRLVCSALTRAGYRAHSAQHGLVVFATSKGLISAVNGRGDHVWANYFPSGWPGGADRTVMVPTLAVMSLHRHAVPTTVLAGACVTPVVLLLVPWSVCMA